MTMFPKKTPARIALEKAKADAKKRKQAFGIGRKSRLGVKTTQGTDGRTYRSGLEREFYQRELAPLAAAGTLSDIRHEERVTIEIEGERWTGYPDFSAVVTKTGVREWWECKGGATKDMDRWKNWRKVWRIAGPGRLHVIFGDKNGWRETEVIEPKRRGESECSTK